MPIRVFHCDDSLAFRALVREVLDAETDLDLVGAAADGESAVTEVSSTQPDIVLLDVVFQGGGDALVTRLREAVPKARLLVLSGHPDPDALAGADARLSKSEAITSLPDAIRGLAADRSDPV